MELKTSNPLFFVIFILTLILMEYFDNTKSLSSLMIIPLTPTQKTSLEGFMRTHNRPMPDFIPDAQVVFDPASEKGIQMETAPYHVNLIQKVWLHA